jgi:NDP-sugar pyrophosphorylase family protein
MLGNGCCIGAKVEIAGATTVADGVVVPEEVSLWNCVLWPGAKLEAGMQLRGAVVGSEGVIAAVKEDNICQPSP